MSNTKLDDFISEKDALNKLNISKDNLRKYITINNIKLLEFNGVKYYKKSDIENLLKLQSEFLKKYISRTEVIKILGSEKKLEIARKQGKINMYDIPEYARTNYYGRNGKGYVKEEVDILNGESLKKKYIKEEYLGLDESLEYLGINYKKFYRMRNSLGIKGLTITSKGAEKYFLKQDLDKIKEQLNIDNLRGNDLEEYMEKNGYLTKGKVMEILDLKERRMDSLVRENIIRPAIVKYNKNYYSLNDIEDFIKKRCEYWDKYISHKELLDYGKQLGGFTVGTLEQKMGEDEFFRTKYEKPINYFLTKEDNSFKVYDRQQACKRVEEYQSKKKLEDIEFKSMFETFEYRLGIRGIKFNSENSLTEKLWMNMVRKKLNDKQVSKRTIKTNLAKYLTATNYLCNMLQCYEKSEIYSLKISQINWYLNKEIPTDSTHAEIYRFIKNISKRIKETKNIIWDISKLKKPPQRERKKTEEESIYKYEEYLKLFYYVNNIELHKQKSLEYLEKNNDISYASMWLYVIILLNNAWRNGDVVNFLRIDLNSEKFVQYKSLEWLKNNDISLDDAKLIANKVRQRQIKISKTRVRGKFHCSEDLAQAFSTAVLICETFWCNNNFNREKLLEFNTEDNSPTERQMEIFFKEFELDKFKLGSTKLNSSIMTYIEQYNLQLGNGRLGLILNKKLRYHVDEENTKKYIHLGEEEINLLTRQLFDRGEFGYIIDILVRITSKETKTMLERTNDIVEIKKYFGTVSKIENMSAFLNKYRKSQDEIVSMFIEKVVVTSDKLPKMENESEEEYRIRVKDYREKGIYECLKILNNIYMNNLPSNEENIQCLLSEQLPNSCIKKEEGPDACESCPYSIPNIYSLDVICKNLTKMLYEIQSETNEGEILKASNIIHIYMEILQGAIKKFGSDFVFSNMDISKDEFIRLSRCVDFPENINNRIDTKRVY